MSGNFNYEKVFMGVTVKDKKNYFRSFKDDYRLKRLTEAVDVPTGNILDIGCGGGVLTESLVHYFPQASVYGCDISAQAIKYAQKLGSGKVKYAVIKDKKLPYKDNFFDVCVCLDVMEHIPDVDFFLKEVRRILKKNGHFFLLVPCEGQPLTHTWLFQKIKIGSRMTYNNWGHIHPEFTQKHVINLLEKHGFVIKKKTYSEHFLYQLADVFTYFLPKEIMNAVLGKKAEQYLDNAVVTTKIKGNKEKKDIMMLVRSVWFVYSKVFRRVTHWELDAFKNIPHMAWKMHIYAKKKD